MILIQFSLNTDRSVEAAVSVCKCCNVTGYCNLRVCWSFRLFNREPLEVELGLTCPKCPLFGNLPDWTWEFTDINGHVWTFRAVSGSLVQFQIMHVLNGKFSGFLLSEHE